MERTAWTDERLDDFSRRMDAGFERVIADLRELRADVGGVRSEMHEEIGGVREEIGGLRGETHREIGGLRGELGGKLDALQATLLRVGGAMIVALIGVIAAVLARG